MNAPINMAAMSSCGCGGSGSCGGACGATCETQTYVRPLFFAGQLLTEDDLQSLEDYVQAKNRLHNRHLFGSGVVCGLEVLCDPCDHGKVWVRPGYALDCCGNDLSLSCPRPLDVNAMIRDLLRDLRGGQDCGDPCTKEARDAATKQGKVPIREYCLIARYCEQKTDPVSPYATDAPCSPQACEASRVREGIQFALRCREPPGPPDDIFAALEHCFGDAIKIDRLVSLALSQRGIKAVEEELEHKFDRVLKLTFTEMKALLLDMIDRSRHPTACTLRDKVKAVQEDDPDQPQQDSVPRTQYTPRGETGKTKLVQILLDLVSECVCMALLPPCAPCDDMDVELACIRVQGCDVVEICNLSRHFVLAPASMRYWFGVGRIERLAEQLCCPTEECSKLHAPASPDALMAQVALRFQEGFARRTGLPIAAVMERINDALPILTRGKPEPPPPDPKIADLQKQVSDLTGHLAEQKRALEALQHEVAGQKDKPTEPESPSAGGARKPK
jgi:hypothetical protein